MKEKINQYKTIVSEIIIGSILINVFALGIVNSLTFAFTLQFAYLFICDYMIRRHLIISKRRLKWNILIGILKSVVILATFLQQPLIAILLTIMSVISSRLMFHKDEDRTVRTVDELKKAYFIPVIANTCKLIKDRFFYVLSK